MKNEETEEHWEMTWTTLKGTNISDAESEAIMSLSSECGVLHNDSAQYSVMHISHLMPQRLVPWYHGENFEPAVNSTTKSITTPS